MYLVEKITNHLQQELNLEHLKLFLSGNHLTVVCADPCFAELSKIKSHQLIYKGLNTFIFNGEIHAVRIHTFATFDEFNNFLINSPPQDIT